MALLPLNRKRCTQIMGLVRRNQPKPQTDCEFSESALILCWRCECVLKTAPPCQFSNMAETRSFADLVHTTTNGN